MGDGLKISTLLRSLSPKSEEDCQLLQMALACAERFRATSGLAVTAVVGSEPWSRTSMALPGGFRELRGFLESLPRESVNDFHSLAEAVEIYKAIHGASPVIRPGSLLDDVVSELRRIRDYCHDETLRILH